MTSDPKRAPLLAALAHYRRHWPAEGPTVDRVVAFVERHGDCFERSQRAGHVTGSAWLVSADGGRVLLTHHRKLDIWVQLGGHCDGAHDTLAVALQEAAEESGLTDIVPVSREVFDVDAHTIPARGQEPEHVHYDVRYALRATGNEDYAVSAESHDLAWVPVTDVATLTREASMLRMADKWLARPRPR